VWLVVTIEGEARLADVPQALSRIPVEAAFEQRAHARGRGGGQLTPGDLAREHGGEDVGDRLAGEEPPARQHLVQHHAESPDVGAPVHGLPARLLRRHVGGGAKDDAGARARVRQRRGLREIDGGGPALRGFARPGLREAEIQHLDLAVGRQLDVRRFQVAVDDALLVGFLQGLGDLLGDLDGLPHGEGAAGEALREVLALDKLENQEPPPVVLLEAVDLGDVGVVEGGEEAGLALEASQALRVRREGPGKHLDRHLAAEGRVLGAVDLTHATGAEAPADAIVGERLADHRGACKARRLSMILSGRSRAESGIAPGPIRASSLDSGGAGLSSSTGPRRRPGPRARRRGAARRRRGR